MPVYTNVYTRARTYGHSLTRGGYPITSGIIHDDKQKVKETCFDIDQYLQRIACTENITTKVCIIESMFDYIIIHNKWFLQYAPRCAQIIEKKLKELSESVMWCKSAYYLQLMK